MSENETHVLTTDQAEREASGAHPYGRYLEEFEVGAVYKHWPAKTVTESDDHLFCLITMNHHPLHLNDVYAGRVPAGPERRRRAARLLAGARDVGQRRLRQGDRQPRHRGAEPSGAGLPRRHALLRVRGAGRPAVEDEARPRDRQGPHPRLQAGQHARRRVQAHGADPAQGPGEEARPRPSGWSWPIPTQPSPRPERPPDRAAAVGGARSPSAAGSLSGPTGRRCRTTLASSSSPAAGSGRWRRSLGSARSWRRCSGSSTRRQSARRERGQRAAGRAPRGRGVPMLAIKQGCVGGPARSGGLLRGRRRADRAAPRRRRRRDDVVWEVDPDFGYEVPRGCTGLEADPGPGAAAAPALRRSRPRLRARGTGRRARSASATRSPARCRGWTEAIAAAAGWPPAPTANWREVSERRGSVRDHDRVWRRTPASCGARSRSRGRQRRARGRCCG